MAVEVADVGVRPGKQNDSPSPRREIADGADLSAAYPGDVAQDKHLRLVEGPGAEGAQGNAVELQTRIANGSGGQRLPGEVEIPGAARHHHADMPGNESGEVAPVVDSQGILFDLHVPAQESAAAGSGCELQFGTPPGLKLDRAPLHPLPVDEQIYAELLPNAFRSVDHFGADPPSASRSGQPAAGFHGGDKAIAAAGKFEIRGVYRGPGPLRGASRGDLQPAGGREIGKDEKLPLHPPVLEVMLGSAQGLLDMGPFLAHGELSQRLRQLPVDRDGIGGKGDDADLVPGGKQLQQADRPGAQTLEDAHRPGPKASAVRGVEKDRGCHRSRAAEPSALSAAQGRTCEGEDESGDSEGAQQQNQPLTQADAAHAALVQAAQETEVAEWKGLGTAPMQQVNGQRNRGRRQGYQRRGVEEMHGTRPARGPGIEGSWEGRGPGAAEGCGHPGGAIRKQGTASLPPQSPRAPLPVPKPRSDSS